MLPGLTIRRMLVMAGVACMAAMGLGAAAVASGVLEQVFTPHAEYFEAASEMADAGTGELED